MRRGRIAVAFRRVSSHNIFAFGPSSAGLVSLGRVIMLLCRFWCAIWGSRPGMRAERDACGSKQLATEAPAFPTALCIPGEGGFPALLSIYARQPFARRYREEGSLPGRREMSWKVRHPCGTAQLIEINQANYVNYVTTAPTNPLSFNSPQQVSFCPKTPPQNPLPRYSEYPPYARYCSPPPPL